MDVNARKNIVITQSNYIPWKGYFDAIGAADEFVVYDDMQYTRRDWRNRNLVKTAGGPEWLTIPVEVSGKFHQKINETKLSDPRWFAKHWKTIEQSYAKAAHFKEVKDFLGELYHGATSPWLTEVNVHFLRGICGFLGLPFRYRLSSEFTLAEDRTERLVAICRELGGTDYYSGPAAQAYMDEGQFAQQGIRVHYFDYGGYPEYRQLFPPFTHQVSVVDLLMNEGANARQFMKTTPPATL
jgi:hypothetical protein